MLEAADERTNAHMHHALPALLPTSLDALARGAFLPRVAFRHAMHAGSLAVPRAAPPAAVAVPMPSVALARHAIRASSRGAADTRRRLQPVERSQPQREMRGEMIYYSSLSPYHHRCPAFVAFRPRIFQPAVCCHAHLEEPPRERVAAEIHHVHALERV